MLECVKQRERGAHAAQTKPKSCCFTKEHQLHYRDHLQMLYSLKVILEHALYSFFCFYKLSLENYLFCPQRYLSSQYDDKDKTDSDFM